MATSVGMSHDQAFCGSYSPSPFLAGYGYNPEYFSAAGFTAELDDHRLFEYSQPETAPVALAGGWEEYHDSRKSMRHESEEKRSRVNGRIGFRTRSEVEILDDGFKWRKYGKKAVKNSPNPRNYYRCSTEGCDVKKRVERDRDDNCYVVTTYDGVHNHTSPCDAAFQYTRVYYSPPCSNGSPPSSATYSTDSLLF